MCVAITHCEGRNPSEGQQSGNWGRGRNKLA